MQIPDAYARFPPTNIEAIFKSIVLIEFLN